MAEALKVLGQVNPTAALLTEVYQVPEYTTAVVSSIMVTNRSATATTFRIAVAPLAVPDSLEQYVFYDAPILGNDTVGAVVGVTLSAFDVVRVYATLGTLSFSLFGSEYTN